MDDTGYEDKIVVPYPLGISYVVAFLEKTGIETEDYAYLLFYHPKEVEEDGDVVFHKDLMRIDMNKILKGFEEMV